MKLDARRLSLPLPRVSVGAEYSIAEKISDGVSEIRAFWEIREVGLEKVLQVAWVRGDDAVEAAEGRSFESERSVLLAEHAGNPLVRVASESRHQRRQHPEDRPNGQAVAFLLPQGIYSYENENRHEKLERLNMVEEIHLARNKNIRGGRERERRREGGEVGGVEDIHGIGMIVVATASACSS